MGEDGTHVILRREDGEGPQNARVSHFEVLRRASPAQDDVGIFRAARDDIDRPGTSIDRGELQHLHAIALHDLSVRGGLLSGLSGDLLLD